MSAPFFPFFLAGAGKYTFAAWLLSNLRLRTLHHIQTPKRTPWPGPLSVQVGAHNMYHLVHVVLSAAAVTLRVMYMATGHPGQRYISLRFICLFLYFSDSNLENCVHI